MTAADGVGHSPPGRSVRDTAVDAAIEIPRGYGPPPILATLSAAPEHFRVTEIDKFRPDGQGTHAWLHIRKRGVNTEEVAAALARTAGAPRSAVGFAGMKDRLAVAIQRFSVDLAGRAEPRWEGLESDAIEVLEVTRHPRKLRRGALLGSRFERAGVHPAARGLCDHRARGDLLARTVPGIRR